MNTTEAQIDAWMAAGRGPYASEELNAAFQRLNFGGNHWKDSIDMEIEKDQMDILSYAVPWHCGGPPPDFVELPNGKIQMKHLGYWAYIGS